jgi:hypothetical protein
MFTVLFEELGKFLTTANATMKDINQFILMVAFASFIILFSLASAISRVIDSISTAVNERYEMKIIDQGRERLESSYVSMAERCFNDGNYEEAKNFLAAYDKSTKTIEGGGIGESDDVKHQSGKESVSE